MEICDKELVPLLPKSVEVFASAGAGFDWADVDILANHGQSFICGLQQPTKAISTVNQAKSIIDQSLITSAIQVSSAATVPLPLPSPSPILLSSASFLPSGSLHGSPKPYDHVQPNNIYTAMIIRQLHLTTHKGIH